MPPSRPPRLSRLYPLVTSSLSLPSAHRQPPRSFFFTCPSDVGESYSRCSINIRFLYLRRTQMGTKTLKRSREMTALNSEQMVHKRNPVFLIHSFICCVRHKIHSLPSQIGFFFLLLFLVLPATHATLVNGRITALSMSVSSVPRTFYNHSTHFQHVVICFSQLSSNLP